MRVNEVDGNLFKDLVVGGYNNLKNNVDMINNLNVFPVPDGDTGTNMKRTLENGISNINKSKNIGHVSRDLAKGMLFGARGNSGVILSQYFKGISNYLKDKETASTLDIKESLTEGYKTAYKAVVEPTEGTILTVAREGIDDLNYKVNESTTLNDFLLEFDKRMKKSLDETPDKLPILKEANVVDSGGMGLIKIFEGMLNFLDGEINANFESDMNTTDKGIKKEDINNYFDENSELEYGYCTEFILQLQNKKCNVKEFDIKTFIDYLNTIGNSIVAVKDGSIIKVHVHTKTPGLVIEFAQKYGEFISFKLENMALQHNEVLTKKEVKKTVHKKTGIVTVCQGDGLMNFFKTMNADVVLNGGQTMNTSTEEFIEAFNKIDADNIIVLPNNKYIILSANQAKDLYKNANIYVLPTSSIAEGYFAMSMMLDPNAIISEQIDSMKQGMKDVNTIGVTHAIRDTNINNIICKKGDYIALIDGKMVCADKDLVNCTKKAIDLVKDIDSKQIVAIFEGQHSKDSEANQIKDYVNKKNAFIDVGIINGKQDVYDFIIGVC